MSRDPFDTRGESAEAHIGLDPEQRTTGLLPIRAQGFACCRQPCRSLQCLRRRDPGRGNCATIAARIAEDTF